ncbi:MAG TPA: hypothetical protein ENK78_01540, partial [Thiothrix sp.]|nr:hypothetical protein [Thiothrix sp.]
MIRQNCTHLHDSPNRPEPMNLGEEKTMRDNSLTTDQPLKPHLKDGLKVSTYTKLFRGNTIADIITDITIGSKHIGKRACDYLKGFAHFRSLMGLTLVVSTFISLINLLLDIDGGASNWHLLQEAFIVSALLVSAVYWLFAETEAQEKTATDTTTASSIAPSIEQVNDHAILIKNHNTVDIKEKTQPLTHQLECQQNNDRLNLNVQFKQWRFTPSETEIAYLLLKGLSF